MYLVIGILVFLILLLLINLINNSFKIGYYEQTIENNAHHFSQRRLEQYRDVRDSFFAFLK